ncbi:hypothetical protein KPB2_5372 [Klebsiella pneumoniae Kb677]|nr:hypothetical protein KPB2_5372 [Klebsiella pneumoniae Kb677]
MPTTARLARPSLSCRSQVRRVRCRTRVAASSPTPATVSATPSRTRPPSRLLAGPCFIAHTAAGHAAVRGAGAGSRAGRQPRPATRGLAPSTAGGYTRSRDRARRSPAGTKALASAARPVPTSSSKGRQAALSRRSGTATRQGATAVSRRQGRPLSGRPTVRRALGPRPGART